MKIEAVSKRLLLSLPVLFIFFVASNTVYHYGISQDLEREFVKRQSQTLNSYMVMHREFYQNLYIGGTYNLTEKTLVGLPAVSSSIISEQFSKNNSFNVTVKMVSDRARNSNNQADTGELKAIKHFQSDTQSKEYFQKESDYYQYATPLFIEPKCLICHGSRESAPEFVARKYERGYDYQLGDLRGIVSVKIPTDEVKKYFNVQFLKRLFYDFIVVLIVLIASAYLIRYFSRLNISLESKVQSRTRALERSAYTDALTGLNNRAKLQASLPRFKTPAMAFIDIDNFSKTNDFYGHHLGDKIIVSLGNMLKAMTSEVENIHLFRLNGDEFVIICDNADHRHFIERITLLLEAINSAPFSVDNYEISLDVTAGLSFETRELLLSTTDIALKHAKKTKKSLVVYDESLSIEKSYKNNRSWSKILKKAIKDDRLMPYFQPIINNHTGKVEKYEALVRLITEEGKVVSPFYFLNVAKQSKQYHCITKTVVDKAFETFSTLEQKVSINISIEDIVDMDIQNHIISSLHQYGIGERVIFEIVETEKISDYSEIIAFIEKVKVFGCQIAIDDFGAGYSNFEYLIRFNADYIKIDGSLIQHLDTDANAKHLVASIVAFAQELGMRTTAEFVKNAQIQAIVTELGIDFSQGFYFSEATPKPQEVDVSKL